MCALLCKRGRSLINPHGLACDPPPVSAELAELSALQLRSKAYWGYDAAFMAACKEELTLSQEDLSETALAAGEVDGALAGVAQVGSRGSDADLLALFVDPPFMGAGLGRALFDWCVAAARKVSQTQLLIDADPGAAPFYERMGATRIGTVPSGSIPGRELPLMSYDLR